MLRLATRLVSPFSQGLKIPNSNFDLANSIGFLNAPDTPLMGFWDKFSCLNPANIYNALDGFSRELIFTLSSDWGLGLPAAIVISTFFVRSFFFWPTIRSQATALKMKEIKPDMELYKEKVRAAQMSKNMALMKKAQADFKLKQKQKGIDNFYSLVSILQAPLLFTWFFSIRHISNLPEVYPSVSQPFLWIPDLSSFDPYFIVPILTTILTSYSIIMSPALNSGTNVNPVLEPFIKYLKFMPVLSLPFVGFFPTTLNIYLFSAALYQSVITLAMNTRYVRERYVLNTKREAKSQILKAVFVEEKGSPAAQMKNQKPQEPSLQIPKDTKVQQMQILTKKPKKSLKKQEKK